MFFLRQLFLLIFLISSSNKIFSSSFPILPEFQAYQNVGNRGSNYSTAAFGLSIHLYDEQNGPARYLHLLNLIIPKETFGWKSRVRNVFLNEEGYGLELGVHDQWKNQLGKGATLSVRRIKWPKVIREGKELREGISEILHLGWSWISSRPTFLVWLMGLDISSINLSHDRIFELQIGLGIRTSF